MSDERSSHGKDPDKQTGQEPLEWNELKDFIVEQVKRAGRRIDVDTIKGYVRQRGGNIDRLVDQLAERGYLSKSGRSVGMPHAPEAPYGPGGYRWETRIAEFERRMQRHAGRHAEHMQKHAAHMQRHAERDAFRHGGTGLSRDDEPHGKFWLFHQYRKKIFRKAENSFSGLRAHLSTFIGVNAFLVGIWLFLTHAGFPWFVFPLFGWGIGLANHASAAIQRRREKRDVEALPELTDEETRFLNRAHKSRAAFAGHFTTTLAVTAFLFVTNLVTSPHFLWFLIPSGGLVLSLFIHWSNYAPKIRGMKKQLREWIRMGGARRAVPDESVETVGAEEPTVVQEAAAIRRSLLTQIANLDKEHEAIGAGMQPLLDSYFEQIRQLAHKKREIDDLVSEIPLASIREDRAKLERKMNETVKPSLRSEYEKSIGEIDRHMQSVVELQHSREVIELRLTSGVNLMKQLQLDLARVKGLSATGPSSLDLLKSKRDELSAYLEDLESGFSEIDSDS